MRPQEQTIRILPRLTEKKPPFQVVFFVFSYILVLI